MLDLLTSDLRNMPRRQRTLFSAIEWSYSLLTPQQATLLRRLAVFRGGWTQEAVHTLSEYADELPALVEKNLVRRAFSGSYRYTMLESIREYAFIQLEKSGELAQAHHAHAQWVCQFAEYAMHQLQTAEHTDMIRQIQEEDDNIYVALDYLASQPDALQIYARIIISMSWIWNFLQIASRPFKHAKHAIAQADKLPEALRAHLLVAGGHHADALGHYDFAEAWQREGLQIFEALGDAVQADYTRFFLSGRTINLTEAIATLSQLRKNAIKRQDDFLLCLVSVNLGVSYVSKGHYEQSKMILEEGLAIAERHGYWLFIPIYYLNLSDAYAAQGDIARSFRLLEQAHAMSRMSGSQYSEAYSLFELCELCYQIGRWDELQSYLRQTEIIVKDLNTPILWVRFYFWRSILATHYEDIPQFYINYSQVLRQIRTDHANLSQYVMNSLLYLAYIMAIKGRHLPECANLLGSVDAYVVSLAVHYRDYQQVWREQLVQLLDDAYPQAYELGKTEDFLTALQTAESLLDALLE